MVSVGLPQALPASELLQSENVEFFLLCLPVPWGPWGFGPAPHSEDWPSPGPAPRSDRGLPSRELARLAWDPPHAQDRSLSRADRLMLSSSAIMAS